MQNLLITGGCGFIGANFIRYLLEETDFEGRIINADKLTYAGNPESLTDIKAKFPEQYEFERVDVCDKAALETLFSAYAIDSVCHFAAESHVDRSIYEPGAFIQTNIIGTYNLLECARERQVRIKRFHHISTDEVFGSLGPEGRFSETTAYQPNSPYSASKASSDHLVRAYNHTYGLPITISNCSNNYGPYQFPEKLIPLVILNALDGQELPVYGDGKNVRDWLYVRDHCVAIWKIITQGVEGETYNIGGNYEMENVRIVEMIADRLDDVAEALPEGPRRELITFVKDRPGHDRRYAIDSSKIEKELGWKPEESFASGLKKTIRWYMDNEEWVLGIRSGDYKNWVEKHYG